MRVGAMPLAGGGWPIVITETDGSRWRGATPSPPLVRSQRGCWWRTKGPTTDMIPTKSTCVLKDGYLCIKEVDTASADPEFLVRYYPMFHCSPSDAAQMGFPVDREMHRVGTFSYVTKDSDDRRTYELLDAGQTRPIAFERVPAERPKTGGKQLRWCCGRWQKLLKTGWVEVPFVNMP